MGHRREVFRPTTSRKSRQQIRQALIERDYPSAANIAAFSYSSRPIADDFTIALVSAAEAISLGRKLNWRRDTEDLVADGISIAERKLETKINRHRYPIVFEGIVRSVERARKEESHQDEREW